MPPWWRSWPTWSKQPAASRISEAARRHHARPDRRRAMAAVVEATHRQSDLRGRPLLPHDARDPTATALWPPWSKPLAASRISEATRYCRTRPDRHRTVVAVVEAARRAMVAGARLGGATAALVLIVVPTALVNDHLLLLEHGPLRVSDGGCDGMMAAATTGTTSRCAPRQPCPRPCRVVALSQAITPLLLGEEREERIRCS
jgi:hypothetical protein